ncbi:hypothetical protein PPERSA_04918 [Pseudocohnilembus persalinus]|uniref:Transmembrane protein n=1 Tax=Pseudocohnilembus persalinus TaxID=266149 RepID=A0A0V0R8D9_PSEPJ|nr:hypothetical protein PPERSA_04918 [Pseudocohnilembus persalinus]|eukprot:KRX10751.1 hypothetical protein PPERSA_04918 [Pseudocohnilembus persalinus]
MGGTFYFNSCSRIFDINAQSGSDTDLQVVRKIIVLFIFLTYLIYLAIVTLGILKDKYPYNRPQKKINLGKNVELQKNEGQQQQQDDGNNNRQEAQNEQELVHFQKFEDFFYPFFGYHLIAAGFCIAFSPFTFAWVVCLIHFLIFVTIIAIGFKKPNLFREKIIIFQILFAICQILNFMLMVAGLDSLASSLADNAEVYQQCFINQLSLA